MRSLFDSPMSHLSLIEERERKNRESESVCMRERERKTERKESVCVRERERMS